MAERHQGKGWAWRKWLPGPDGGGVWVLVVLPSDWGIIRRGLAWRIIQAYTAGAAVE